FRRNPAEKRQVVSTLRPRSVEVFRQTVIDRRLPVCPLHRSALRVRDGDQPHVVEFTEQRVQIRNVQPPVQRADGRHLALANHRKGDVVDVEVDDVVLTAFLADQFGKKNVLREGIIGFGTAKTESAVADGAEPGGGPGVATGVEGYIMSGTD